MTGEEIGRAVELTAAGIIGGIVHALAVHTRVRRVLDEYADLCQRLAEHEANLRRRERRGQHPPVRNTR